MHLPKFSAQGQQFHTELKKRIQAYFQETEQKMTGNWKLYSKAILLILSMAAVYTHLIFFTPGTFWAILECVVLGGLTASIGFNIMHDGMHGSFSSKKWANELAGLTLNFLGANNFMWRSKHNIIHHTYTNIEGVDDDLEARPLLRLCPSQPRMMIHRVQHWYFWIAYSLLYIWWIFFTDYKKYFLGRIGEIPLQPMKWTDHLSFWGFKLIHAGIFMVIPIVFLGWKVWLVGFLIYALFTGLVLSLVFQLAHTVEDTSFPEPMPGKQIMEHEWAIHQLKTTANFATRNRFISWWVGGLNFQIEHHLFPRISHIHYPAISEIIRKACADFNIPYLEHPRMRLAIASHVRHLKSLSRP